VSHKVNDEVWAHASTRVRTTPLVVLLRMADASNDDRMMWESMPTIARRTGLTDRAVRKAVRELEELCIVESIPKDRAPAEASKYRSYVRRIRPVEDWMFADLEDDNPERGSALNPERGSVTGGNPERGSSNPSNQLVVREIEETTSLPPRRAARSRSEEDEEASRPGGKGWGAVVAPKRGGRKKSRKQQAEEAAQAERELDPAFVVARSLDENTPSFTLYGDLPASDDDVAPPVRRPHERRSTRPSEVLASFFDKRAQEVGHPVPGATNIGALTGNFGRWMREGTSKEEITKMIITYWSPSWQRSENVPAWKDFLAARGLLVQRRGKAEVADQVEANRFNEEYWA
jgi:hypothetical protein